MESTQRTQPNALLRQQRLLRGWSLQHVVEQLCSLCQEEEDVPGVTADMVSKWERGERKPSRFYQTKLCVLYKSTADQLGFIEAQYTPEPIPTSDNQVALTASTFVPSLSTSTQAIEALSNLENEEVAEALAAHLLTLSSRQLAT